MGERRIVMKFCTKCGKQLNDDDIFCPACGAKQVAVEQPAPKEEEHRFNFEEARQEQARQQQPVQETKQEKPKKEVKDTFSPTNSFVLFIGYVVLFIVYLILNKYVFNEDAMLGKLGFLFATMVSTMIIIINLVKCKNRHKQFLMIMHLVFVIVMASCIVGVFITLIMS